MATAGSGDVSERPRRASGGVLKQARTERRRVELHVSAGVGTSRDGTTVRMLELGDVERAVVVAVENAVEHVDLVIRQRVPVWHVRLIRLACWAAKRGAHERRKGVTRDGAPAACAMLLDCMNQRGQSTRRASTTGGGSIALATRGRLAQQSAEGGDARALLMAPQRADNVTNLILVVTQQILR